MSLVTDISQLIKAPAGVIQFAKDGTEWIVDIPLVYQNMKQLLKNNL